MRDLIKLFALPIVALFATPAWPEQAPGTAPALSGSAAISEPLTPPDSDEYATFVQRAETGNRDLDFRAMRLAYIRSAAFIRANKATEQLQVFRKEMFSAMADDNAVRVRDTARRILGIVYIDLDAQKALRQSCKILKDEACADQYHYIQFGLLKSILATGDGKSCATAWETVTIDEEYFILRMRGFSLKKQEGPSGSKLCDKMSGVVEGGQPLTLYFGVKPIFEGYQRLLNK